jgi:hypothetical protein
MNGALKSCAVVVAALSVAACATTSFDSTWKAPDAQPVGSFAGKKIIGFVMSKNEASRRAAEDALARELTARGAQGVPGYTVVPVDVTDEATAKGLVEKSGAAGVVVMRPVGKEKEVYSTPTMYTGPYYGGFWGGYYGYGWGGAWGGSEVRTNTIVSVETLVYSLEQNKLIWAGQSKTTNPSKVDSFVREIVNETANEMKKAGLL